jgi:hypothetical protein
MGRFVVHTSPGQYAVARFQSEVIGVRSEQQKITAELWSDSKILSVIGAGLMSVAAAHR